MNKQLDNANQTFLLFKKVTNYVKENFVNVLQTILILGILLSMYLGYRWVVQLLEGYPSSTYTVEETQEGFKTDSIINAILDDMLGMYNADRAKLVQFHNGTHSLGGIAFKYISTTHEAVRAGVSSEILNYQNIPTSILGDYAKTLMNSGFVKIEDTNDMENTAYKQLLQQQAINARCMYPIFDRAGRFTGFVAIDWVYKDMPTPIDGSCICDGLVKESNIIENILFSDDD